MAEIMDGITHRIVAVNGIKMHVAEKGEGPVVLFIHGFPQLWYTWRHQIVDIAARGYHAVAPDLRGFGDTDGPGAVSKYTMLHIVGDVVALISALGQDQVFVVGHDWGAIVAWNLCMFRPDKVKALVNMSVANSPRHPSIPPIDYLKKTLGDDYYICRFQEPGEIEAFFARYGTEYVLKAMYGYRKSSPLFISKEFQEPPLEITLPSWLTQDDLNYYTSKYERSGFTGGINYYRNLNVTWELTAPWTGAQIRVTVKFMVGDLDLTYHSPGIQDYINKGGLKKDVPLLQEVIVMDGVGHFINEEKPVEVSEHIYNFIQKF